MSRRARAPAALALAALALSGCETTAEKSARLERAALAHATRPAAAGAGAGAAVKASRELRVIDASIVRSTEGYAVAVTVENDSATAQLGAPISITVLGRDGSHLYNNSEGGLQHSLVALPLIEAHRRITWVDDQVQASGPPARVTAVVGDGGQVTLPARRRGRSRLGGDVTVGEYRSGTEGGLETVTGRLTNGSSLAQTELVVFAVARRGGRVVAAGRAVIASLDPGASSPFQVFMTGSAKRAQLELSAPATVAR